MWTGDRSLDSSTPSTMPRHPWFAATYDILMRWGESRVLHQLRQRVAGVAAGQVLEIGAGTGANFPYYMSPAAHVAATEPDPFMLDRARRRVAEPGLAIDLLQCPAEVLPFADASFDTIVATLVFCTVADLDRSLAEVRRVLKPTGSFRFIEHVRAEGLLGHLQDALTPLQRRIAAGCHLNRRTAEAIEAAGFELVELEQRRMVLIPLIIGVARPRI